MTNFLETDLLADRISKKHDLLVQMRDLGKRQIEFIELGDLTQLLRVLSAKQRLLSGLQSVEKELLPFRNQDPESRTWRSAEDRARCAQIARSTETLLAEIMLQERQSETHLSARRDEAAVALEGAHTAAEARGAYTNYAPQGGHLDLSSGY